MKRTVEDERPIKKLCWPGEYESSLTVDFEGNGIEKIVPYQEFGDSAYVTWFAVYKNGEITQRINAANIDTVVYS